MTISKLSHMKGGWFIGAFEPSILKTNTFEVAVQHFDAGECVTRHVHKVAWEYTVIISGDAAVNGISVSAGNIIVIKPGESADFRAITKVATVVVKTPSLPTDKFPVSSQQ